ncbi:hypothetical protein [Legionella sp. MW5194]|uniref:hypothetical protein n=1 Tax=Legionella sp. MW5194 TaxID=2662448 RepID=UPI00193D15E6|nr:hypothetical protein [Legionella sp. MW5194]
MKLFKKNDGIKRIDGNGDLSKLPQEIFEEILGHLDSKSARNIRVSSKENLEKFDEAISNVNFAKKLGLINLSKRDLIAVGENVAYRVFGISDFYGKKRQPSEKEIKNSFKKEVILFFNENDADKYIKSKTVYNEFNGDEIDSKPHKANVKSTDKNNMFRIKKITEKEKDLALIACGNEIDDKITFNK